MTKTPLSAVSYFNLLECPELISCFLQYPPVDFSVMVSDEGLPCFFTPFDILTTLQDAWRNRIRAWWGYHRWQHLLQLDACFIGTTVSEYALFPRQLNPEPLLSWLQKACLPQKSLTIIKDLPQNSPLLSEEDNAFSARLIAAGEQQGFIRVEGQALAYVPIDFTSTDEYLSRLSHSRRRNIRRKLKSRAALRVEILNTGDPRFSDGRWLSSLYQLYFAVYQQSDIHFDLMREDFFIHLLQDGNSNGKVFFYWLDETLIGYNICYRQHDKLIDKYIGLNYPLAREYNLYFVSWFENLKYAMASGLKFYVAGWTDPQVKADLGASFTFTYHLVWVRNTLLRRLFLRFRHYFESDTQWHREQSS